ncbi:MBL fold metallo-hydrolase [Candidatus Kaiserbacteria bacterium]|nr:MBL fold metallo-hydrolase [Candidatus Kaiserbacteria bacterium]
MKDHSGKASVTFYGGAGTVTGANFLLDAGDPANGRGAGVKILFDCGALEREHVCDTSNGMPFAYDLRSIDTLIVTHAHADHIGRIPKLVHDGFKGTIYSTAATKDLAELMFEDAIKVMEMDVERHGCEMIYQKEDVVAALTLWRTQDYHDPFEVGSATIEFFDAGHILGAAMVKVTHAMEGQTFHGRSDLPSSRSILFTGDLGNSPEPLLNDTEAPAGVNYVVMESVYGDRLHEGRDDRTDILRRAIEDTRMRNGVLLIPSFSIERTQILLYEIEKMIEDGAMEPIRVYLDAPLAIKITEVFRRHKDLLNAQVRARFEAGNDPFTFGGLKLTADASESHEIHNAPNPKVIIAGAGMSAGGRIRSHEKQYLPDEKATVLFVGYQAPGSLGRQIADGNKHVTIDGEKIRVRAQIATLTGYSGHRDRDGLMEFVEQLGDSLERVFVVMGEPKSEMFLSQRIRDFLGVEAIAPEQGQKIEIDW